MKKPSRTNQELLEENSTLKQRIREQEQLELECTLAKKMLSESEANLKESQGIATLGSWFYYLTGELSWSDEMYRIYGMSPETFTPKVESLVNLIHPEDRFAMLGWINACLAGENPGELEFRSILPDGTVRIISGRGKLIPGDGQRPIHMSGTAQDITERKLVEEAVRLSDEQMKAYFESAGDAIYVLNVDTGQIVNCNSLACLNLGYSKAELMKLSSTDIESRLSSGEVDALHHDLKPGEVKTVEGNHKRKDGSVFPVEIRINLLSSVKPVLMIAIVRDITERKRSEHALKESFERLHKSLGATIQAIAVTVEERDPYTAGHQRRVADLARSIATEMNLPIDMIDGIRMAAAIHDLGKISVPAEILSKPTKLKKAEFDLIKNHSQSGYDILKDIDFPRPIARIVLEHHERMNGSGYPNGLTGDNILMEARILTVADVVEAMASHRPYRPGLGIDAALNEIEKNRGIFYDDAVVDACLRLFREKGFKFEGT